ncbi:MAG: methyltransferase domain-containing protein [Kiritimatiellae bacterium]|nr:methyltransferase domain-containing protein [Kiritimatiellia bacterium]
MASESIQRHNEEIQRNLERWRKKPLLRAVYHDLYRTIAGYVRHDLAGPTVELGSGCGHIKTVLPDCVTSDLFDNPWVDRKESAYRLSFDRNRLSNVVMFHVFHHLRYPGSALDEVRRVLQPGGRLVVFDPYVSLLGLLVYGALHHEPLAWRTPIAWRAPAGFELEQDTYYAAQGNATRVFGRRRDNRPLPGWREVAVRKLSTISYILSGGYSKPQMYPACLHGAMKRLDRICDRFPILFATSILVVLEKTGE